MSRRFDAIVVGSGLGGLTAGALYARAGRRILVLERNDSCGGAATVYRHDGLAIEASLHELDGLDENDAKSPLLHSLGLSRKLRFVDIPDLYEVRGALIGKPFVLPHGMAAAQAAAAARFPHHKDGLLAYFERVGAAREAVQFAGQHRESDAGWWLRHAPEAVRRVWPLLREGRASVGEVLNELFGADEAVKVALAANLAYYHDDPDRMSFLHYAMPQASYLTGGGHYVHGGSAALSGALVELIREAGGSIEVGREVDTLLLNVSGVTGVRHHARGGNDVAFDYAPVVFGNAAPHRLADMLPHAAREPFFAPYAHRPLSISLWSVSLGLARPASELGVGHYATFMLPPWMKALADLRESAATLADPELRRLPAYVLVDYRQIDTGLNEGGPSLVTLCGIDRIENWTALSTSQKAERKERWMERLIADLEREFPGMADAVVHREMATAETLSHYLNTPDGAVYGFAPEAGLVDTFNFTPRTHVDGLWLASAYTFGGGFSGAMLGGAEAARHALRSQRG